MHKEKIAFRMNLQSQVHTKARPFLKWAGGKTQLLPTLDYYLPLHFSDEAKITYIEPFIGGGAALFYFLQKYQNINKAIINDLNPHLICTYRVIKDAPRDLIALLRELQSFFKSNTNYERQKQFYLDIRNRFNHTRLDAVEDAAYMVFLNRTCFNGLYRENSKGEFNVPFGRYSNPTICDEELIYTDSQLLQKVEILMGDFSQISNFITDDYTFIYFDPPYRPLDSTSSFNSYVKQAFDDNEQIRLRDFFTYLSSKGCYCMLSNSDCKGRNESDIFFDELYSEYTIERVYAKRHINANPNKRGALTELLIRNYSEHQRDNQAIF